MSRLKLNMPKKAICKIKADRNVSIKLRFLGLRVMKDRSPCDGWDKLGSEHSDLRVMKGKQDGPLVAWRKRGDGQRLEPISLARRN